MMDSVRFLKGWIDFMKQLKKFATDE